MLCTAWQASKRHSFSNESLSSFEHQQSCNLHFALRLVALVEQPVQEAQLQSQLAT